MTWKKPGIFSVPKRNLRGTVVTQLLEKPPKPGQSLENWDELYPYTHMAWSYSRKHTNDGT
jgi:hypothetical protein